MRSGRMATTSVKKILVVGPKRSGKLSFLEALTGTLPSAIPADSHGGLTHEFTIRNQYYEAIVGIWIEEFEDDRAGLTEFVASYGSDEAAVVRDSLNVLVVTFRENSDKDKVIQLLESVKTVADKCLPETLLLAIGTSSKAGRGSAGSQDGETAWEDTCLDEGFEYIDLAASGKNTFGEKRGVERVKEAIEACDWSEQASDPSEEELLADLLKEDSILNEHLLDSGEPQKPINLDEAKIEDLELMMHRMLAARGESIMEAVFDFVWI